MKIKPLFIHRGDIVDLGDLAKIAHAQAKEILGKRADIRILPIVAEIGGGYVVVAEVNGRTNNRSQGKDAE